MMNLKERVIEVEILYCLDEDDLAKEIKSYLMSGYQCQGGPYVNNGYVHQLMIKDTEITPFIQVGRNNE